MPFQIDWEIKPQRPLKQPEFPSDFGQITRNSRTQRCSLPKVWALWLLKQQPKQSANRNIFCFHYYVQDKRGVGTTMVFSKKILKSFLTPKKLKNGPQKLLIIGPDSFFQLSSPDHSPQPKIDFPYHEILGPDICFLICESNSMRWHFMALTSKSGQYSKVY